MKREYFTGLFLLFSVTTVITLEYFFDNETIEEYLHKFIVVWLLLAIYAGQYSMRFPKRF